MGGAGRCEIPDQPAVVRGARVHPLECHASPVNYETAAYTVNRITAQESLGAYEPLNRTNEFTVKLGFRF